MDGNFSFLDGKTIVHSAPGWSIRALSSVQAAINEAVQIAADPDAPVQEVKSAFDKASTLIRINSQDAPPGIRTQILELLSLKPLLRVKGPKRKLLIAGIMLCALLNNYGTWKSNTVELVSDIGSVAEWVFDNVGEFSADLKAQITQILEEDTEK